MAKKLQILRGTTAQNDAYTGSIGELTMDTEKVEVRIHDGTTQGGKTIGSGSASLPILTHVFSDHKLNDISWLNADTFSWQSGDVYVAAYEHLLNDYNSLPAGVLYAWSYSGETYYTKTSTPVRDDPLFNADGTRATPLGGEANIAKTGTDADGDWISYMYPDNQYWRDTSKDITLSTPDSATETISGITITYYKAEDGHKICLPDQETNVLALYEATGVAWYYILDTANKQFKLPRTKFGFTGLRDTVGGYVEAGLPNITGSVGLGHLTANGGEGALRYEYGSNAANYGTTTSSNAVNVRFDASRSSSVYGNSDTVQPKATQMYLYFYVGNFEQTALEQTAGITSEQLNNKADLEIFNAIYPVGSIYIGTQATCPMAIAIKGSTWELLEAGRALWTGNGSNGNTKIAAGLPNITGSVGIKNQAGVGLTDHSGAFYASFTNKYAPTTGSSTDATGNAAFDASRSSSVYGNSTTVQPPAYVVNVWRRTA